MIGYMYYIEGQHDISIQEFQKVLLRYPDSYMDHLAETHMFLGFLYELANRRSDALI